MKWMRRFVMVWVVLLAVAVVPAAAQDVAATAAEIGGASVTLPAWTMWAVVVVIAAVLGFASWVEHTKNQQVREVMNTLDVAIKGLSASTPAVVKQPAQALVAGGVNAGFGYLEEKVTSRTPGKWDDELSDEAEERLKKLLRKWGLLPPEEDETPEVTPSTNG